jgi:hypothetical protein
VKIDQAVGRFLAIAASAYISGILAVHVALTIASFAHPTGHSAISRSPMC